MIFGLAAMLMASCTVVTRDSPTVRRVSADGFMAAHTFKGLPTDQFIGTTGNLFNHGSGRKPEKAFKQIWSAYAGWGIIWCPTSELPEDFLRSAHEQPWRETNGL
jgi:hypothetical protein